MPLLKIELQTGASRQEDRPVGEIGNFPDQDGVYQLNTGEELIIEMNPPEAVAQGIMAIALTSSLFEGHMRGAGYRGKRRRVVTIGKKGQGSLNLSSFEILRVTLNGK